MKEDGRFLDAGCFGRNYDSNDRVKLSSTALESYGCLLSNAPSLAIIRAVLATLQRGGSASKTKKIYERNCQIASKISVFRKIGGIRKSKNIFKIFKNIFIRANPLVASDSKSAPTVRESTSLTPRSYRLDCAVGDGRLGPFGGQSTPSTDTVQESIPNFHRSTR
jgi:hypothetical protein